MKGIKASSRITSGRNSGALHLLIPAACALLLIITSLSSAQQQGTAADWKTVEQALGKSGSIQPGDVYKVSFPRSDLKVTAAGVELKPALALGTWVAFKRMGDTTVAMGDLV